MSEFTYTDKKGVWHNALNFTHEQRTGLKFEALKIQDISQVEGFPEGLLSDNEKRAILPNMWTLLYPELELPASIIQKSREEEE